MRASRRRRLVLTASLGTAAFLAAAVAWTVHLGLDVRDRLEATRDALAHLRVVVSARDPARIAAALAEADRHAVEARRLTGGPDWAVLTSLPVVGDAATTVRGLARSAAELTGTLSGLREVGTPFIAGGAHPWRDVRRTLTAIHEAAPVLSGAVTRVSRARGALADTPVRSGVDALDRARGVALHEFDRLGGWLGAAAKAARLVPPMLGHDGPRRYFLAFQTNAEARGTGGLVGAFGVLEADHGDIGVSGLSANNGLVGSPRPVADNGPAYLARYGRDAVKLLSISNLSPHFPYAAATWTGLWERKTHRPLDGAIAIDPVGLSYVLGLIGPVTLPGGEQVNAANVVDLTERAAYARYADAVERKRFLLRIATAVAEAMPRAFTAPARLVPVLKLVMDERRIQVWSSRRDEERILAGTPLGGVLPEAPGPYAGLVVNNSAGGKLDYYLNRSLEYELGPCRNGRRSTAVRIRLTNDVPHEPLPSYVTGRLDNPQPPRPVGSNLLWVSLYAGIGSEIRVASLDERRVTVIKEVERSHPVYSTLLEIAPGQSRTLRFDLVEPASGRSPEVPVQPLARPQHTRIISDRQGCS